MERNAMNHTVAGPVMRKVTVLKPENQVTGDLPAQTKPILKEPVMATISAPLPIIKKTTKGKTKPLYFWNSADVNKWLRKHGGQYHDLYGELFLEQEVTGRTLIRINEIKLERMGMTNVEHRKELMQHILKLRLKHEMLDLKNLDQKGSGFELKLPDSKQSSIKEKKDKPS
ncbi:hypothetical protein ScPMuIL_005787 [Solemya velum]